MQERHSLSKDKQSQQQKKIKLLTQKLLDIQKSGGSVRPLRPSVSAERDNDSRSPQNNQSKKIIIKHQHGSSNSIGSGA
jgi:hypothetical protein